MHDKTRKEFGIMLKALCQAISVELQFFTLSVFDSFGELDRDRIFKVLVLTVFHLTADEEKQHGAEFLLVDVHV
jgi:hypothetical protein